MELIIGILLSGEVKKAGVQIVGPESADQDIRASTISFVVMGQDEKTKRLQSKDAVTEDLWQTAGCISKHYIVQRNKKKEEGNKN